MAVVLAYTTLAIGHLFPFCALLTELASRGHQVHARTLHVGEPSPGDSGSDGGAGVQPPNQLQSQEICTTGSALRVVSKTVEVLAGRAAIEAAVSHGAVSSVNPDAALVDANCWGAISTAETKQIPWLCSLSPFIPYRTQSGITPVRARQPAPTRLGRRGSRLRYAGGDGCNFPTVSPAPASTPFVPR